jgi:signal transduction histidine kinase
LDQGPGVPAPELKLIFEPFYRGSNTNASGHGLGLAIAIRIVEALSGSITARNREQGGLKVDIELPLSAAITQ